IPRPESEYVVMECLRLAKGIPEPRVLDIGTGAGNLAIAVAHQRPDARVTAIDISPEALVVAKRNAEQHNVANRIHFLTGDLFGPLQTDTHAPIDNQDEGAKRKPLTTPPLPTHQFFDFILSNPPYISQEELGNLPRGVRDYEPHLALDSGRGGFAVFDRLIAD